MRVYEGDIGTDRHTAECSKSSKVAFNMCEGGQCLSTSDKAKHYPHQSVALMDTAIWHGCSV